MASDPGIYGLIRPYDPGPGPLEQAGQLMQIKSMMARGGLQDLQAQKTLGEIEHKGLESQILKIKMVRDRVNQVTGDADMPAAREDIARIVGPDAVAKIPFLNMPFSLENQAKVIMSVNEKIKRISPELKFENLGATMQGVNPYTAAPVGAPLPRTQTPNERASTMPNIEGKIRDDYNKASLQFVSVRDAHQRVIESARDPSAAGDLSLIFNYMKVLDPGSTVREGEFATAQNSGSIPNIILAKYNKVIAGERLAPDVRADFLDRSGKLYKAAEKNQKTIEEQYTGVSTRSGVNPANVVLPQRVVETTAPGQAQPTQTEIDAELRRRGAIR